MKLVRYGAAGAEKPGLLAADGALRDLSGVVRDFDAEALSACGLARLSALDPQSLPRVEGSPRLGACVPRPINIVCIGLNYRDHAAESGLAAPKEPIIFLKSLSAYSGPFDDLVIPRGAEKTDWEIELGIVIGSTARYVARADAMNHVAGYCVVNDVSERAFQIERGGQWDKGKGCDTFGPIGPWLVTRDEIPDPQRLSMWLDVDGRRMQNGNTANMIFGVEEIVSYVSHFITLHPGDVIATGTPAGVGLGMKPHPVFLRPGQEVRAGIEGLGEQRQRTRAA
jgi:2-keto-4-pentenoate hydratase/2-oxohepta-3-ene-1,7-dioic acid hydratase in catechol pathway